MTKVGPSGDRQPKSVLWGTDFGRRSFGVLMSEVGPSGIRPKSVLQGTDDRSRGPTDFGPLGNRLPGDRPKLVFQGTDNRSRSFGGPTKVGPSPTAALFAHPMC